MYVDKEKKLFQEMAPKNELKGDGKLQIQRASEPKSIENKRFKPRNIMIKCMDTEDKEKIKSFLRKK